MKTHLGKNQLHSLSILLLAMSCFQLFKGYSVCLFVPLGYSDDQGIAISASYFKAFANF